MRTATAVTKASFNKKPSPFLRSLKTEKELWILSAPIIIWIAIFAYYPMYGILMAFFNYTPGKEIFQCKFVGLKYFESFINNPVLFQILRNTLVMSALSLTLGFIAPIIFGLLLNEIGNIRSKKFVQTVSYLPHFISWVVAGSMIYMLLSNEGAVNNLLIALGFMSKPVSFLNTGKYYWAIYIIANIWKEIGWAAIIYLSAISGVDSELYEAGTIDGLGRFGLVWHITIPGIMPTILLLLILNIGSILNAGFDYHLIVGNPTTQPYWDVIDTYSYRYGVQQGYYSMGTAVSLMKSMIGFGLVCFSNWIAKKTTGLSIF